MTSNIIDIIYSAIDDLNRQNPAQKKISKTPDTLLFGSDSTLDSLGLINLVVGTEQKLEEKMGISVTLADDRALSQDISPFTSVQTLADYISVLIREKQNAA